MSLNENVSGVENMCEKKRTKRRKWFKEIISSEDRSGSYYPDSKEKRLKLQKSLFRH